ncbi:MAG: hemerythrin domain-containing protein [Myxococcales bacterium]
MNALRLLQNQHDRLEGLLVDLREAAAKGDGPRRAALAGFLKEARAHFDAEELQFYPAVKPRLILVEAAPFLDEHSPLRAKLDRLEATGETGGAAFDEAWEAIHEALVQHVSDEEIEMFTEVRRRFDVDELDALGDRIEQALPPEGPSPAPAPEPEPEPEGAAAQHQPESERAEQPREAEHHQH